MVDQIELPYLHASIEELQRLTTLTNFNLPRRTIEDVSIGKYRIAKRATVIAQMHVVHMDECYFKRPEVFDPTRHLDQNGYFVKDEKITPFRIGKRACLGESRENGAVFIHRKSISEIRI